MNNEVSAVTNPYAPPRASVRDITDPTVAVQLADRGARLGAIILDGFVFGIMVYLPLFATAFLPAGENTPGVLGLSITCLGFIVWLWFTLLYMSRSGQSIGKKLVDIKIVRSDGSRASLARLFWLRIVANMALGIIPLYAIIDPLFIFGEARQCLHDKLADTIVIKA